MNQDHLTDETLRALVLRGRALPPDDARHLAGCMECRRLEAQMRALVAWASATDPFHATHAEQMTDVLLGSWLAGTLSGEAAERVNTTVQACPVCAGRLRFVLEDLRDWGITVHIVPPDLEDGDGLVASPSRCHGIGVPITCSLS